MRVGVAAHATIGFCFLSLLASAQNERRVPNKAADAVPRGGRIMAMMQNTIDAGKARVGDTVRMTAVKWGLSGSGAVIPRLAELSGRVVEAVPRSKSSPESRLSIVVERAEWKGGFVPLKAFVVGQASVVVPGPISGDNIMHDDEFSRDRPHARANDTRSPALPADTELLATGQRTSATVLISHKRNVVLKHGMVLILRDGDAQEWAACEGMHLAQFRQGARAKYPKGAHGHPVVALALTIEIDGTVSQATPVGVGNFIGEDGHEYEPDPQERAALQDIFSEAAVAAARNWRFQPATCGSTPVRQQIQWDVRF